ncbi:MAG TPA: hypothetical protein VG291_05780 [Xanthobacteraceae bacterium]|nr:hypothetical protein [Xanthobacteraceae bacterium]
MTVVSAPMREADTAFAAVKDFYLSSRYGKRRLRPDDRAGAAGVRAGGGLSATRSAFR